MIYTLMLSTGKYGVLNVGDQFMHDHNKHMYAIAGFGRMKIENKWHECVIYSDTEGQLFVQTADTFNDGRFIRNVIGSAQP